LLANTIREKDPRQLCFPWALWTLGMVRELIERKFGIKGTSKNLMQYLR